VNEQEIRAAALHAAGTYAGSIGGAKPEDLLYVADVYAVYITDGRDAALARFAQMEAEKAAAKKSVDSPSTHTLPTTELREARPLGLVQPDVHPEKIRTAQNLLTEARKAKVAAHKNLLKQRAVNAGVLDVPITDGNRTVTLKDVLGV
jgi:hypothetical protein